MVLQHYEFSVHWSEDDQEWVGRCHQYSLISYLDPDPQRAMAGIIALVHDYIQEQIA